jgi:hypothetical protein
VSIIESKRLREEFKQRATASWGELEGTNKENEKPKGIFDLEKDIIEFCRRVHPAILEAALIEEWNHAPSGHIKTVLASIFGSSETIAEQFIDDVRSNKTFRKFVLIPKYSHHKGQQLPWQIKQGKTFFRRRPFMKAELGVNLGYGSPIIGSSTRWYTVKIEKH